jgi:signal peptide peptidase SppA
MDAEIERTDDDAPASGTPAAATPQPPILSPSADARRDLLQAALLERPWAIQRSTLALMARAGGLPAHAERPEIEASSMLERLGGFIAGGAAVVPVYGAISYRYSFWNWLFGGSSIDMLRAAIKEQLDDSSVGAVVLDVDSPGGCVDGLPEIAAWLRSVRGGDKPIVAVANTLAASAAYWIATQVDELVVTPSGSVGSVGVYAMHEDDSALLEMAGIKITLISAGPYKVEGNPYEPLTDEARATIQADVDAFYAMFVADVAKGRGITADKVIADFGGGRDLLAKPALASGLVDRIDTLENTVKRLSSGSRSRRSAEAKSPSIAAASNHTQPAIAAAAPKRRFRSRADWLAHISTGSSH